MSERASGSSRVLSDVFSFTSAKYVAMVFSAVRGLLLARWLGPAGFGTWSVLGLVMKYADQSHFGLRHAVNKEVPTTRGRGEVELAEEMQGASFLAVLIFSATVALGLLMATLVLDLSPLLRAGLWITAAVIVLIQVSSFLNAVLRINYRFAAFSKVVLLMEGMSLVAVVALVPFWGVLGAITALAVAHGLISLYVVLTNRDLMAVLRRHFHWSWKIVRMMGVVGLPIVLFGYLVTFMVTADKLVVLQQFDREQFGMYSFAGMVVGMISMLPSNVGYVLFPSLGETFGANDTQQLQKYLILPTQVLAAIAPLLIGLGIAALPWFLSLALPQYLGVFPTLNILLIGSFFFMLSGVAGSVLIVSNRYLTYGLLLTMGILLNAGIAFLLVRAGYGLPGAATGAATAFAIYGTTIFHIALRGVGIRSREALKIQVSCVWPLPYNLAWIAAGTLAVRAWSESGATGFWTALLFSLTLVAANIPVFVWVDRRVGLVERLGRMLRRGRRSANDEDGEPPPAARTTGETPAGSGVGEP